ncbi:hypothetical protein [Nonomuraea jiangxiensis]|uniref:Uncharacterized protein n=1 Tax=Nonomuraea jiangxiensis TaxID=633440 RepID=A0A1G9NAF5_9ACTN|nr:hypothetical protein [Nonomuraea jiangxiensis]SDL83440.1 hypothetical protein SAMN05421869_13186 [Nonomuraea jiangxiensis]
MTVLTPSAAQASSASSLAYELWGVYHSRTACETAGANLTRSGRASSWYCIPPHAQVRGWKLWIG